MMFLKEKIWKLCTYRRDASEAMGKRYTYDVPNHRQAYEGQRLEPALQAEPVNV